MVIPGKAGLFGKYREIVLAIAFFLVFDLMVLVLNFYISYQIAADAVAINLAGRQRMLSQRMTKSIALMQIDQGRGVDVEPVQKELENASRLFAQTLEAFRAGGQVTGSDERVVTIQAVSVPAAVAIVAEADGVWSNYHAAINQILAKSPAPEQIEMAIGVARRANVKLLQLMNGLTNELELVATAKADRLRRVQAGGIALALLNFIFILMKFVRKLQESDRQIEAAQKETGEILKTVKDGLFLLDRDGRIGLLHSASLDAILRREVQAGTDFLAMLRPMLGEDSFATASEYIHLLFGDRVKENLVTALNPMQEVAVVDVGADGAAQTRYLAFHFNRVVADGRLDHLLVTVSDITEKKHLAAKLESARAEKRQELDVLLNILKVQPQVMRGFLADTGLALAEINDGLRQGAERPETVREVIDRAFRAIHAIKGNAALLELESFEQQAHAIERVLVDLRNQAAPSGDALLNLAVRLEEFFERLDFVKTVFGRLADYQGDGELSQDESAALLRRLRGLVQRIAGDHGKTVRLEARLEHFSHLPERTRSGLTEIATQLARNAVVHGIELPAERLALEKPGLATLQVSCEALPDKGFEFVVRDDGRGLVPARIRESLARAGTAPEALAALSDKQVIQKLFEPGFSTLGQADRDAGHGFGLDVVQARVRELGGHLNILSRPDAYTEFRIRVAA